VLLRTIYSAAPPLSPTPVLVPAALMLRWIIVSLCCGGVAGLLQPWRPIPRGCAAAHPRGAPVVFRGGGLHAGRTRNPRMSTEEEDELEGLDDIGTCEGRIVTELKDVVNGQLPDRFMMAVQAIRGEFSPPDEVPDTERTDDLILQALTNFPATVRLKVVSRAVPEEELDGLVRDVTKLCESVPGGSDAEVDVVPRGSRRSIGFALRVPNANALAELRDALMQDPRVQMVF